MTTNVANPGRTITLLMLALAIGAMDFYVAEADDAPGAAVSGLLLMLVALWIAVRSARGQLAPWTGRLVLIVGALAAGVAGVLAQPAIVAARLFPLADHIPSTMEAAPAARWTPAVERARALARSAMSAQNVPGLSVAVGVGRDVVWAEGFGWRDVYTQTPVTPTTRFHIGTAASVVTPDVARGLDLPHTGLDTAEDWSPEHVGEPEEDFPGFVLLREVLWKPLGLMASEPLRGERATFFVPRVDNDPRRGRRPMYMRDLACCAGKQAFSSTPSDLVRVGLSTGTSVDGRLAGGTVTSLLTLPDSTVVVAVSSNIAYTDTAALATRIGQVFATAAR